MVVLATDQPSTGAVYSHDVNSIGPKLLLASIAQPCPAVHLKGNRGSPL